MLPRAAVPHPALAERHLSVTQQPAQAVPPKSPSVDVSSYGWVISPSVGVLGLLIGYVRDRRSRRARGELRRQLDEIPGKIASGDGRKRD